MMSVLSRGWIEFTRGAADVECWTWIASRNVRVAYRTSAIGMFWSTLALGAQIAVASFVYAHLTSVPLAIMLPWVAIGLVVWQFLGHVVQQALLLFAVNRSYLQNFRRSMHTYFVAAYAQATVQAGHNLLIVAAACLVAGYNPGAGLLWLVPGFVLFTLAVAWIGIPLALAATYAPPVANVVAIVLNLSFFMCPILFLPSALGSKAWLLTLNPLTHVIASLREPLLGHAIPSVSVAVCLGLALIGWPVCLVATGMFRDRLAHWI